VLVPVDQVGRTGLMVVRRTIEPARGRLALLGGFLEEHESWQEGAAREVREESCVRIDPAALAPFWFASPPRPNMVLLFSVAPIVPAAALEPFAPCPESSERGLIFGPGGLDDLIAFPLHVEAARRWFAARGVSADHAYAVV